MACPKDPGENVVTDTQLQAFHLFFCWFFFFKPEVTSANLSSFGQWRSRRQRGVQGGCDTASVDPNSSDLFLSPLSFVHLFRLVANLRAFWSFNSNLSSYFLLGHGRGRVLVCDSSKGRFPGAYQRGGPWIWVVVGRRFTKSYS